jgi:hypothetical protein
VSFDAITLYVVASQQVFVVVSLYFVIESVRKLLVTPTYMYINATRNETLALPSVSFVIKGDVSTEINQKLSS